MGTVFFAKPTLGRKFFVFTWMICMVSITIASAVFFLVSSSYIHQKNERNSSVLLGAAVDTTNKVLSSVSQVINDLEKNKEFENLVKHPDLSGSSYSSSYRGLYLEANNMALMNDEIDSIIISFPNGNVLATNKVYSYSEKSVRFRDPSFLEKLSEQTEQRGSSVYLLDVDYYGDTQNIAIIKPLFDAGSQSVKACTVILLNTQLTHELGFIDKNLFLQYGSNAEATRVSLLHKGVVGAMHPNAQVRPLIFGGWFIGFENDIDLVEKYVSFFSIVLPLSILYCSVTAICARKLCGYLFSPLKDIVQQVTVLDPAKLGSERVQPTKRRISFTKAAMIFFFAVSCIPMIAVTLSGEAWCNHILKTDVGNILDKHTDILGKKINLVFKDMKGTVKEIALSKQLQSYLTQAEPTMEQPAFMDTVFKIRQVKNTNVLNMALYNNSQRLIYSSSYTGAYMQEQDIFTDYQKEFKNGAGQYWTWHATNCFNQSLYRIIMRVICVDPESGAYGRSIGYLVMDFSDEEVKRIITPALGESSALMSLDIVDKNGRSVMGPGLSPKQDGMLFTRDLSVADWRLQISVERSQYRLEQSMVVTTIGIMFLSLLLCSLFLSYILRSFMSASMNSLKSTLKKIEKGDLHAVFASHQRDEVYELGQSINHMISRINQLIDEKYVMELNAKEFQLNFLQSQMNPHFLYNTLRTIEVLAYTSNDRTCEVIRKLIFLLKEGVNNKSNFVSLQDEVNYIQSYMDIQNVRFENRFRIEYRIPKDYLEYQVLRFIIQPLVENSIYHGIGNLENGGCISISAELIDHLLLIRVKDNGAGIAPEKVRQLQEQFKGNLPGKSIGLLNVNDRIKLHYGNDYGLTVESVQGQHTCVTIRIPK